jgi:flagellar hook-basal body complex protein FliE
MTPIDPITAASAGLSGVFSDSPLHTRIDAATRTGEAAGIGNPFAVMVEAVNGLQAQAANLEEQLHSDNPVELHRVMIAAEQAGTAMDLLIEVRNRLVETYQELMRMQI